MATTRSIPWGCGKRGLCPFVPGHGDPRAHHAMTAGSIILLDTTRIDGLAPITRLTPDAPFPESETYVLPKNWHAPGARRTT